MSVSSFVCMSSSVVWIEFIPLKTGSIAPVSVATIGSQLEVTVVAPSHVLTATAILASNIFIYKANPKNTISQKIVVQKIFFIVVT